MIHLFLNGSAASAGGGLTYLRNVIPQLARRQDVRATVAVTDTLRGEFQEVPNVSFVDLDFSASSALRFVQEQTKLRSLIACSGADVLVSAGNFALYRSPVPQILLSRNSLYTSPEFYRDLRERRDYGLLLDTWIKGVIARKSIHWADCTVAPSNAFAQELEEWAHHEIITIRHGFDADAFFADNVPPPEAVRGMLVPRDETLRLLFVSHYNYYRNFETLLRAIPILRDRLAPRKIEVVFTCKFQSTTNPGSYLASRAAQLIEQLGIASSVIELGAVPYAMLHHVYGTCNVYVSPAYAESFAHPLVEAMASGLPVVASDRPVHREICERAALYFSPFVPEELADAVIHAAGENERNRLTGEGRLRAKAYSWEVHVSKLLELANDLLAKKTFKTSAAKIKA
jgi:glycosyltransferase involved in cell wall biosynthesis